MTDRDRLAADLWEPWAIDNPAGGGQCGVCGEDWHGIEGMAQQAADRLIALGWGNVAAERARIRAAVEGLHMQQDGDIVTLDGTRRRPWTPADYVEVYRAAVLRIIDGGQR